MLSDTDQAILTFERNHWHYQGSKEQAIRDTFDIPVTRYFQRLNALIDDPEALAAHPVLVKRLQRIRDSRREARAAGRGR